MILTYHELGLQASNDVYRVSVSQFEEHLAMLRDLAGVSRPAYPDYNVTFDDGHISHFDLALSALTRYGMRSAFFITTDWIGETHRMSHQQIRDVAIAGHHIGSHTSSHPFLPSCSNERLWEELSSSRKKLEDILGSAVTTISVPYGRWDRRVLRACQGTGYTCVYTSDPWLELAERDGIAASGRLTVRNSFSTSHLRSLLTAKGITKVCLQTPFKVKQTFKRCIGDRMYHRLWHQFARRDASLTFGAEGQQ